MPGQGACINAGNARQIMGGQPALQIRFGPPVGRAGHLIADNHAQRKRLVGFNIISIGPGITNMWEGKGYQLACIGRVSYDLLISRH